MSSMLPLITLALLVISVVLLALVYRRTGRPTSLALDQRIDSLEKAHERTERVIKEEIALNRTELGKSASDQRQELAAAFKTFSDSVAQRIAEGATAQKGQLEAFAEQLGSFRRTSDQKLDGTRADAADHARQLREEVSAALKGITDITTTTMGELANVQKGQLEAMASSIDKLAESNEKKLEAVRTTVEGELNGLKEQNSAQLEQMRLTVDEKLQGTLEKRLGDSFKLVSERLEQVHRGLGEMQTLATGVGDLKKVLTNVKTRGTWGEVQLGALLEAQEQADLEGIEAAGKKLESSVRSCACDISEKYLAPPSTTDFGILYLPTEGLFAESIRRTGLVEGIQRDYRVIIAGPTTLWSILNSLQMGFRTFAIEKRTSEVWNLLSAVKTEWLQYATVLDSVQKKLNQASSKIDEVKVRSRAIGRKLRDVQELPAAGATTLLTPSLLLDAVDVSDSDTDDGELAPG